MATVLVLAILVLAIIGIVALVRATIRSVKRRRAPDVRPDRDPWPVPPEPPPTPSAFTGPPTFKIVALGSQGAGKTVYLASLFHELNHFREGRSYWLEAPYDQVVALGQIYRTLRDTAKPWPTATRPAESTEYTFRVVAKDSLDFKHHVLSFNYIDYAGELLERRQEAGSRSSERLFRSIESAQAILTMIDGLKLLQLLRNESAGREYFEYTIPPLFAIMNSADCPIHLVITKWDLVRNFGEPEEADEVERLDRAITALLEFDYVQGLLSNRQNQIVRVIPVSSVGRSFAHLNPIGLVLKRPEGQLRPTRVEVPLSAVIPDLFKQVESELNEVNRQQVHAEATKSLQLSAVDHLSSIAVFLKQPPGRLLRAIIQPFVGASLTEDVVEMFIDWAAKPYEAHKAQEKCSQQMLENQVGTARGVRAAVFKDFSQAVDRLDFMLPNSRTR